ncbi:SSI family serine proteinase inhibitor [Embleya sp. NPDC056575]|uniref:SSI family serine proteinase inhibitor n=1 Tax=unclassified Embleya TaxID=2699296 RepID=UPI0036CE8B8F
MVLGRLVVSALVLVVGPYSAPAAVAVSAPVATGASGMGDRLTLTVTNTPGGAGVYTLECHPAAGGHPAPRQACERLDSLTLWGRDPFAPVPHGAMCTMIHGGPAAAHITGVWAGRPVDAAFDRTDGCEIARWDDLVPVLPRVGD